MYESFDASCQGIENILIQRREEERMAHIQRETLQMLVSFLTPFKEASLQLEADTYMQHFLFFYQQDATCCIA
jgi:hypothetical protein